MDRWMDGWMAFIRPLDLKISAEFFTYLHIYVFFFTISTRTEHRDK